MKMTAPQISWHETRHLFGSAVAICALDPSRYSDAKALFDMKPNSGEAAVFFGAHVDEFSKRVASLSALAPISKLADPEAIYATVQNGSHAEHQRAGDLSAKDLQLSGEFSHSGTLPAQIVLATFHLEKALGVSRFRKLAKSLRDASNQHLLPDQGWPLEDVVPQAFAASALRQAKKTLKATLDPAPVGETAEENAIRLQKAHDRKQAQLESDKAARHAAERASVKTKRENRP
ncbi:hypothetical protein [Falsiruegeria litorea]|uniref:hypothetical protein n=1 Tax=Falsiruegeria litorea TaxID=1280831 RepID=UPI001BFE1BC6|nr:hypothetical protein [Falsiruegeria litorea]MBT8169669.1 hypothetical protein [Falsiruegeria litorea]